MDQILEGLSGIVGIADDVCVYGEDEKTHNDNLYELLKRAKERGLVFNCAKCYIKQKSISFFGNTYTTDGIKPDEEKILDIRNMPRPTDKEELLKFLGSMTYLS